ncbi:MAG: hypothetical protein OXN84_12735 [Albidovulum sp.]|nr:hypothetical protein [Albidovulum sp.]
MFGFEGVVADGGADSSGAEPTAPEPVLPATIDEAGRQVGSKAKVPKSPVAQTA